MLDRIIRRLLRHAESAAPTPAPAPEARDYLAAADAARDSGHWPEAAALYRKVLAHAPSNAAILVQLGHALKESGDSAGGRDAYLEALRLDPQNSDTALQIGHVEKLLGRPEEAAKWYLRSVVWIPVQPDGYAELHALGISDEDLAQRLSAETGLLPACVAQKRIVLWDVPAASADGSNDVGAGTRAWHTAIAAGLEQLDAVRLCARDECGLAWRLSGDTTGASQNKPAAGLLDGALLVVPVPELKTLDCDLLRRALDAAADHGPSLAALYVPDMTWAGPGASPQRDAALARLAEIAGSARFILVETAADAAAMRPTLQALGLGAEVVAIGLERPLERRPQEAVAGDGPDLVLAPAEPSAMEGIASAYRATRPAGSLIFIGPAPGAGIEGVPEEDGLGLLAAARSLTVPAGRADAAAWAGLALDAGVPVIAERSTRLYSLFGAAVDVYAALDAGLGAAWARIGARAVASTRQRDRFVSALQSCLCEIANTPSAPKKAFAFGYYLGLGAGGTGLHLRSGPGWMPPLPFASQIPAEGLTLALERVPPVSGAIRIAILAAATDPEEVEFVIETPCARGANMVGCLLPPAGWGWLTADIQPTQVSWTSLALRVTARTPGESRAYLCGAVAYPVQRDRFWFEFLDRASRGREPAFRAAIAWAAAEVGTQAEAKRSSQRTAAHPEL